MDRKLSIADLAVLVASFAVSAAVLRFAMTCDLAAMGIRLPKSLQYSAAAAFSLCPLSWTIGCLTMWRTKRSRWASHPAFVVGLTSFSLAVYDFLPRVVPVLRRLSRGRLLDSATLVYGAGMLGHVGKSLLAWAIVLLVAKRIRRPDGWLAMAGWLLWICWVGGDFSRYVATWLS